MLCGGSSAMNLSLRFVVVIVLAACLLVPLRATRVLAALDILLLLPAWALAVRARLTLVPTLGLAATASPVLFGAVVFAAMLAGATPLVAAWIAAAVFAALFLFFGGGTMDGNDTELRIARALFVVALIAGALALTLPISNEWWRVREDSWFHAAVFERIVHHGVPPVDPYFSPLRLQYMYFYHVILAGVSALTGLGPFATMIVVNGAALLGCVFGFGYLSSFFSRRVWPRALGAALLVFGMNGFFYAFFPLRLVRALTGETSGTAMLKHFFPWSPAGHATATRLLSVEENQFLFLDKFMLGTALSLTLGLVCVLLAIMVSARRGHWTRAHSVLMVVAMTGILYLHGVVGTVALTATLLLLALLMLVRSHTGDGAPSYARLTGLVMVAVVIAAPFIYSVMPRGDGGRALAFAIQPRHLLGLLSDILPALILAVPFLRWTGKEDEWRALGGRGGGAADQPDEAPAPSGGLLTGRLFGELSLSATGIVAMWALMVLAMAVVVDLPTNNETKFSFLLFLPLAAFATGGINRMWRSRRSRVSAIVLVAACTVPLNAIYYYQAWHDTSTFTVEDTERAAYQFIARSTPPDAIFIDSGDIVRIPVLAQRDLYWGNETYAFNWGYPVDEVRRRRGIRDAIFGEPGLSDEQAAVLAALDRPVYVFCRGAQFEQYGIFERLNRDSRFEGKFLADEYAVFEMVSATADSTAAP
jgi:hypothetical protein